MAVEPEEPPPQINTVFLVGFGSSDGNGSSRTLNRPAAAVETDSRSTTALAKGSESGTAATRISRRAA